MGKIHKFSLAAIIIIYIIFAFAFSEVTPFNKGPDEGSNLNHIIFIAQQGRLATSFEERVQIGHGANQPALYHLMLAGLSWSLGLDLSAPPQIKIYWDSFRYRAIDIEADSTWYLLTEDQQQPYAGQILILHIGRWVSILLNGFTLIITFLVALELRPRRYWLALTITAFLAFIPTFVFMSSVLNEDAIIALTGAIYLWMLIKIIKYPDRLLPYVILGLSLGVSITAKYTLVLLPLELLLVVGILARQNIKDWQWWLYRVVIVGGCALLASSWWFGWNIWYLNDIQESGWIAGLVRPFFTGGSDRTLARLGYFLSAGDVGASGVPEGQKLGDFSRWVWVTFRSFWGVSVNGQVPGDPYIYGGIIVGTVVAIFGMWRLWRTQATPRYWLLLMMGHSGLFFILPLLRFWMSRRIGETAQGRHILIPGAAAISVLIVWGVAEIVPQRWHKAISLITITVLMIWTGATVDLLANGDGELLPLRTLPQSAEWLSSQVNTQFGESMELVTYDAVVEADSGILHLNLAWRSLAFVNENYRLKVEVIDGDDNTVSHWQGYHGQGRVPTLAWDPGDSVFDRLALPLPNLPSGDYRVQVQVLSTTGPLPINGSNETSLSLTQISINEPTNFEYPWHTSFGSEELAWAVWKTNGPVDVSRQPEYRYPATISVVVAPGNVPDLQVDLVDPAGQVWSPAQTDGGISTFVIGPRWQSGEYRLQLSAGTLSKLVDQPALVVENWWQRQFDVPDVEIPLEANFANQIYLLGYNLPQTQIRAGESFPVTLYWQAPPEKSPQANFIQFNNLLSGSGTLSGGYDRRPLEYYSTLLWAPGEIVVDGYTVPVDADAPPGQYWLDVGYYLVVGESAVNLPLVVDGQRTDASSITIGPIEVKSP